MIIIRFILIFFIVYLLVRGFIKSLFLGDSSRTPEHRRHDKDPNKKVSKEVGEFIDYEEVKD